MTLLSMIEWRNVVSLRQYSQCLVLKFSTNSQEMIKSKQLNIYVWAKIWDFIQRMLLSKMNWQELNIFIQYSLSRQLEIVNVVRYILSTMSICIWSVYQSIKQRKNTIVFAFTREMQLRMEFIQCLMETYI